MIEGLSIMKGNFLKSEKELQKNALLIEKCFFVHADIQLTFLRYQNLVSGVHVEPFTSVLTIISQGDNFQNNTNSYPVNQGKKCDNQSKNEELNTNYDYPEEPSPIKNTDNSKKRLQKSALVEDLYLCPITMEILEEPLVSNCGHTFEKSAINDWMKKNKNCPVCKTEIKKTVPNFALKAIVLIKFPK